MSDAREVAARFIHSNESMHRHEDIGDKSCRYCDLVARYALRALLPEGVGAVLLTRSEDGTVKVTEVVAQQWHVDDYVACAPADGDGVWREVGS